MQNFIETYMVLKSVFFFFFFLRNVFLATVRRIQLYYWIRVIDQGFHV